MEVGHHPSRSWSRSFWVDIQNAALRERLGFSLKLLASRVLKYLLFGYNYQSTQSTGLIRLVVIWSSLCMELRKHWLVFISVHFLAASKVLMIGSIFSISWKPKNMRAILPSPSNTIVAGTPL